MNNLRSRKNSPRFWKSSFQYRLISLLTISACFLTLGTISPATAESNTRTYRSITEDKFNTCVKTSKMSRGYMKYDSGNSGEATLWGYKNRLFGKSSDWVAANLTYNFDSRNNTLEYRLIEVNSPMDESRLWTVFNNMIEKCGGRQ